MPSTIITTETLVPVGVASAVIVAIVGCTWKLSSLITRGISATNTLEDAVKKLSHTMSSHIHESNNRDRQNLEDHAMLKSLGNANVEAIRSSNHRTTRIETELDGLSKNVNSLNTRVGVLESAE